MHIVFSFQVTIRASLTGKNPALPTSPDRSGFTVSPDIFSPQAKSPVSVSKSKANKVTGAGKVKTTQSKKQEGRTTKHNLSLTKLRYVRDTTAITHFNFCETTEFFAKTD